MKYLISSILILSVLIIVVFTQTLSSSKQPEKKSEKFESLNVEYIDNKPAAAKQVIVIFKTNTMDARRQDIFGALGPLNIKTLKATGIYIVTSNSLTTQQLIDYFSTKEEVQSVEPDYFIFPSKIPHDTYFDSLWAFWNLGQPVQGQEGIAGIDIKAKNAWNVATGGRTNVMAVIDCGVDYSHADLTDNIWTAPRSYILDLGQNGGEIQCSAGTHGFDALDLDCDPTDLDNPFDKDNPGAETHGTHVTGIIGAKGNNFQGITGVNWDANILPLRVGNGGRFETSTILIAIEYILQLKYEFGSEANVRIVNASWGTDINSQGLFSAVSRLNAADVLFVAAAGNGGDDHIGDNNDELPVYPASFNIPNVISVASITNTGALSAFSNFGPTSVDLGAPGSRIFSTMRGNNYGYLDGTSQAAPQVSGAALLILSRCDIDTAGLKSLILENTDPTTSLIGKTSTGGRLNVYRALAQCSPEPLPNKYAVRILQSDLFYIADLNDNGQMLGASTIPNIPGVHAILYDVASGYSFLPPHPNGDTHFISALNKHEWATGNFLYTPQNGIQLLGSFPGYSDSRGYGINDAGQVVGDMYKPDFGYVPFLRNPNGEFVLIEPHGKTTGQAKDINNNGQIIGLADVGKSRRAFIYDLNSGLTTDIPVPTGFDPNSIEVNAINDNGVVVGTVFPIDTTIAVGFMYSESRGTTIIAPASFQSILMDVNNAGQAVGLTNEAPFQTRAITYDSTNGLRYLDTMMMPDMSKTPSRAYNINNSGQITVEFGFPCIPFCIPEFPLETAVLTPAQPTAIGSNIAIQSGNVEVTYSNVTATGVTQVEPIPLPSVSSLPTDYLLTSSSMAYNIETTASFTGSNQVCFNLSTIENGPTFNRMSLLHFENGSYVDRTSSRDFSTLEICSVINSFSPFVIAKAPVGPTAAHVTVAGRVTSDEAQGINKAHVTLTDPNENTKTVLTGSFGYFQFENVTVGRTYILSVNAKRYIFTSPSQLINVNDYLDNINFVGHPIAAKLR
jgi:hypothetical protein